MLSFLLWLVSFHLHNLAHAEDSGTLPFFFASVPDAHGTPSSQPLNPVSSWLAGWRHFRILPGFFPQEIGYHFDGLATLLELSFTNSSLSYTVSRFEDQASQRWDSVNFLGTGTGPTKNGHPLSMKNPAVNLLPLGEQQLWLTTDTVFWGSMSTVDLRTLGGRPLGLDSKSTVLNAHPACDASTGECFVQYPCDPNGNPITDQACVSVLAPQASGDLKTIEYSRTTLPKSYLIQHSHEPCVTPNYVVSKLDHFGRRSDKGEAGILEHLQQVEDNLWLVMDRRNNASSLFTSPSLLFVNNHFTNCVEDDDGNIQMGVVPVTSQYLDVYWQDNLAAPRNWSSIFLDPQICVIPMRSTGAGTDTTINCKPMFPNERAPVYFDYPTFNPVFKGNPQSRYFYAIAPADPVTSQWFDSVIKVDTRTYEIQGIWSADGIYVTEADFVSRPGASEEDDGVLLTIVYNTTAGTSALVILDARSMQQADESYNLGQTLPFHAHGISCDPTGKCCSNP